MKNVKAMVMVSFAADALALGAHWIYETVEIDRLFGRPDQLTAPHEKSFHRNRHRGDFTHYGDQALLLLASLAENKTFDPAHFHDTWHAGMKMYDGYLDMATKTTIGNIADGWPPDFAGSRSTDLGGAARIAPLVYWHRDAPQTLFDAVKAQTAMTHNHPHVIESAAFFAQLALESLKSTGSPSRIIQQMGGDDYAHPPFDKWIRAGLESISKDTREAVLEFGQMCEAEAAFPATIHLIAKYEDNPGEGLIQNVAAGGDSAARGLLAGMVLGAYAGADAVPQRWIDEMNAKNKIASFLEMYDAHVNA